MSEPISEERLRNTRAWAAARLGQLSGAEVIVAACDEALAARAAGSVARHTLDCDLVKHRNCTRCSCRPVNPVVAQSDGGGCDIRPEHRPPAGVVERAAQGKVAGSSPAHGALLAKQILEMTNGMGLQYDRSIEESMLLDIVIKARVEVSEQPRGWLTECDMHEDESY